MQKQYFYIVLVVSICLESGGSEESSENAEEEEEEVMDHTFVALIDIVYTDGSKRSCTGAIIDDNVVVTAAHCFVIASEPDIRPELTASFVVIGTKKMFDTGYEQYLPIERVITHPKFHGWSADLSLVFTFAAMTADKPGTIIPLAGEKTATHVDTNATVFSWGRYGDDESSQFSTKSFMGNQKDTQEEKKESSCESPGSVKDAAGSASKESGERDSQSSSFIHLSTHQNSFEHRFRKVQPLRHHRVQKHVQKSLVEPRMHHDRDVERSRPTKPSQDKMKQMSLNNPSKGLSRYLASDDEVQLKLPPKNYEEELLTGRRQRAEQEESLHIGRESLDSYLESIWNKFATTQKEIETTTETPDTSFKSYYKSWRRNMPGEAQETETTLEPETEAIDTSFKSYYKNWRRQMPTQQNSLIVETFGFVNNQVCKKIIERGMSSNYDFSKEKDYLCYSSDEHCITDRDSGAPAVRHGQLVAVTVGGVQCDGDHVGIGMKMVCYCSWIAENVPNGKNMTCCKNCCDPKTKKTTVTENKKINKYLMR